MFKTENNFHIFFLVNNPYPWHPHMFKTKNNFSKIIINYLLSIRELPPSNPQLKTVSPTNLKARHCDFHTISPDANLNAMLREIWYNFKNVKNTHGGLLVLVIKNKASQMIQRKLHQIFRFRIQIQEDFSVQLIKFQVILASAPHLANIKSLLP